MRAYRCRNQSARSARHARLFVLIALTRDIMDMDGKKKRSTTNRDPTSLSQVASGINELIAQIRLADDIEPTFRQFLIAQFDALNYAVALSDKFNPNPAMVDPPSPG